MAFQPQQTDCEDARSDFALVLRRHNRHGLAVAEVCAQRTARKSNVSLPSPTRPETKTKHASAANINVDHVWLACGASPAQLGTAVSGIAEDRPGALALGLEPLVATSSWFRASSAVCIICIPTLHYYHLRRAGQQYAQSQFPTATDFRPHSTLCLPATVRLKLPHHRRPGIPRHLTHASSAEVAAVIANTILPHPPYSMSHNGLARPRACLFRRPWGTYEATTTPLGPAHFPQ